VAARVRRSSAERGATHRTTVGIRAPARQVQQRCPPGAGGRSLAHAGVDRAGMELPDTAVNRTRRGNALWRVPFSPRVLDLSRVLARRPRNRRGRTFTDVHSVCLADVDRRTRADRWPNSCDFSLASRRPADKLQPAFGGPLCATNRAKHAPRRACRTQLPTPNSNPGPPHTGVTHSPVGGERNGDRRLTLPQRPWRYNRVAKCPYRRSGRPARRTAADLTRPTL
jgi:hypothetical protein